MLQQQNLPSATSQALRSCEWWAFFTSLSARIFSKARVRNMFFVFLPSYMSHRNLERGVPGPKETGRESGWRWRPAAASKGDAFRRKCQPREPLNRHTWINTEGWGKSLRMQLTTCLLRHVGREETTSRSVRERPRWGSTERVLV